MRLPSEAKDVVLEINRPRSEQVRKSIRTAWTLAYSKPLGTLGVVIILFFTFVAIAGPVLEPYDPKVTNPDAVFLKPGDPQAWFGTDMLGRDMMSRTIRGAKTSMTVGLAVTVAASLIAATLGITSAYFGGKFDLILQRFIDAKSAFPSLLLALAFMAAFGPSFWSLILALIIIFSSRGVRVIRSQVLSIKEMPYVDAARSIGAGTLRIMARHIAPNTFGIIMVVATTSIGSVIIVEASLSFLGVSAGGVVISWGELVGSRMMRYFNEAPWMVLFPGGALTILVFGVNILGDALRDILDPRMRGR